ncbi:MAG TPA: transglutaminase domain-containing protein, partial [Solirubrobacteraceae bacterium]|nr:transglutaminase domain-containing protein [Solirubrobacteraceae bacterium]
AGPAPSAAALATWTQTLHVTLGLMYTTEVIASGTAQSPANVSGGAVPGPSPGTWIANQQLGPGDAYSVRVYTPDPTPAELAAAGKSYPAELAYYREMFVPVQAPHGVPGSVVFPAFGAPPSPANAGYIRSTLAASPYAGAYRLAQHLQAGEKTPYAYVERVLEYLQPPRYAYNTDAPRSPYPLETFLFGAKYGYCQQFAGAMALLLRMGGIPARVAVGFTPGRQSSATGEWDVSDFEAHAWVEAWFPSYGWVAFNPTPSAATKPQPGVAPGASELRTRGLSSKLHAAAPTPAAAPRHPGGSGLPLAAILAVVVLALALAGAGALVVHGRRRSREPLSSDELVAELERALRRSSFTITPATTLAEIERRFSRSSAAAEYVRAVGRARYADVAEPPSVAQRRALRAQLAAGRGTLGRLRALWALPPRL